MREKVKALKSVKLLSLCLILAVVISTWGGVTAYAAETAQSTLTFTNVLNMDDMDSLKVMKVGEMPVYGVTVSDPNVTLTAVSTDETVISVEMQHISDGDYMYVLTALKAGSATITFTASDGTTRSFSIDVEESTGSTYTITSDTTHDFAIVRGNSYIIKLSFSNSTMYHFPMLMPNDSNVIQATLIEADDNGNYFYRLDAIGDAGDSTDLYAGVYGYAPKILCNVKIGANKNLSVDTIGEYSFNIGDTYRFVAHTASATPPVVSVSNNLASARYLGKVSGGYEYQVKALNGGFSMVRVTSNGETSSIPLFIFGAAIEPYIESDTTERVTIKQGASYTYRVSVMGGGEPKFVGGTGGVISTQIVKKDGIDYYCKVTAVGQPKAETSLYVTFPQSGHSEYNMNLGNIIVAAPDPVVMRSDTNLNFALKKGASYTFKITGATSFNPGTNGIFKTEQVGKSGNDTFYKITAVGNSGQQSGFYMSAPGTAAQKVCVVSVAQPDPVVMRSDTNTNFALKKGSSYTFKITGATSFNPGAGGIFKTEQVGKSGNDTFYKITAVGNPGQQAGFYMSAAGQTPEKVCVVSIIPDGYFVSDTNSDFNQKAGSVYTYKITAPGAKTVDLYPGTNLFWGYTKTRLGDDFYFRMTATMDWGKSSGIYVSVDGKPAVKICTVTLIPPLDTVF